MANTKKKTEEVVDKETVETVKDDSEKSVMQLDAERITLAQQYKNEGLRTVTISPLYKPYFGNTMHVSINGISVYVPCDGRPYQLPVTFATEVSARIQKVDNIIEKGKRMSDVTLNEDATDTPGTLQFFS